MRKKTNIMKLNLNKVIKKFFGTLIIVLGIFLFISQIDFIQVKGATFRNEEIVFTDYTGSVTEIISEDFTLTFSTESTIDSTNGVIVNKDSSITITSTEYIYAIKVVSNASLVLSNLYAPEGIVNYSTSVIDYPNAKNTVTLSALNQTTIKSIEITYKSEAEEYFVLNLYKGKITIGASTFSGVGIDGTSYSSVSYTSSQSFYITQTTVDATTNNIIRYADPISNQIIFTQDAKIKTTVVLDNIWSSSNVSISLPALQSAYKKNIVLKLKGINIICNLYYSTGSDGSTGNGSTLKITSFYDDGSKEGSLIAIGRQTTKSNGTHGSLAQNGWNAVIGGIDSNGSTTGLEIAGGTILAVATAKDQCTAIGAGGNGYAEITISGGCVTAISYTTGTAIGGGIGHNAAGGKAKVTITGGEIYAYNCGQPYKYTYDSSKTLDVADFVPGTAIGGGSSYKSSGNQGTVTITGGYVYAYSNGGSGLGGGNSIREAGGSATINISAGEVTSYGYIPEGEVLKIQNILNQLQTNILDKINGGKIIEETIKPFNYGADGSGIGGGSSNKKNGGSATINISGGYLDASSIGGGNSVEQYGQTATVTVTGGTTICGTIGGGLSNVHGYADGQVYVQGGSLNATMSALPKISASNDEMLYLTRITVLDKDDNKLTHKKVTAITFDNTSYTYGVHEMYTDEEGMLYLWLPSGANIVEGVVQDNNDVSVIIKPYEDQDEKISAYEIGILKQTDNGMYNYYVNTVNSEYYTLYGSYDGTTLSNELENTTIVPSNTLFTLYADIEDGYSVNAYYAVESSSGKKTFQPAIANNIAINLISIAITITQNTTIVFEVISDDDSIHYFIMDLYSGSINVREGETGLIIEQNGYELTGFQGGLYVTSGGVATPNTISFDIGADNSIDLYTNNIIIGSDESCISVKSGTVNLSTGSNNDLILSNENSAIYIEENAKVIINTDGEDALKLYSGDSNISPVSGKGTVIFNNNGGYFKVVTTGSTPQFSVGIYEFSGKNAFTAELFIGEFEFELIGYLDKSNVLHDVSVSMAGNTENFAARGVYKVLNGVLSNSSNDTVTGGNYITVLTADSSIENAVLGTIELTCNGNPLIVGEDYSITYNSSSTKTEATLTIYGSAFIDGNIMIFAAVEGEIPYQIISYTGVYDGNAHIITVAVNLEKFTVYYSRSPLNEENYTNGLTTCPEFTDVTNGKITVYVYICKSNKNTDTLEYNNVSSSGTVEITKGVNSFESNLSCSDVAFGKLPSPSIKAKWGTVTYLYYDENGNLKTDVTSFAIGTYYVRALVVADINGNYDYIETDYTIRFRVIEVKTFTSTTRSLSMAEGISTALSIAVDGSFSVYYNIFSAQGMSIKVANNVASSNPALPVGTKITFIDFPMDSNGIIKYYYYVVKSTDVVDVSNCTIMLTKFILMGSSDEYYQYPLDSEAVQYQFCVEFPSTRKASGEITFTLTDSESNEYDKIIIQSYENAKEEVNISYNTETNTSITYDIAVQANDTEANQVLIIKIDTDDLTGLDLKLYSGNTIIEPVLSNGNMFFYKLSEGAVVDYTYQLKISNTDFTQKTFDISVDVRNTKSSIQYSLGNETESNHKELSNLELQAFQRPQLFVSAADVQRVITSRSSTIYFNIKTTEDTIDYSEMSVELYYKKDGVYERVSILQLNNTAITINRSNASENGTYRIVFTYKGTKFNYNIIVNR